MSQFVIIMLEHFVMPSFKIVSLEFVGMCDKQEISNIISLTCIIFPTHKCPQYN